MNLDLPVLSFKTQSEFEKWLAKNQASSPGIWMKIYKKASGEETVTYDEALDVALCYGWIDGLVKSYDQDSYVQRFTPRRPKSIWSKKNIANVNRLIKAKKMQPAGLAQIEAAKSDGRWEQAYDSPTDMKIPQDFLKELSKDSKAKAFFETLNRTNLYYIAWNLQTAKKPETRQKRMTKILETLSRQEKFH